MLTYRHSLIAREGWPFLAVILAVIVASMLWNLPMSAPWWLVLVVLVFLFRDPTRQVPSSPLAIVSPIHGTVIEEGPARDPWLERDAVMVKLGMSYHQIYTLRSPIEGKVLRQYSGSNDGKSGQGGPHHQGAYWIQTDEGDDVTLCIEVNRFPSRMRCYAHPGERVGQGQRCGYLYFGGFVTVYLPGNSRVEAKAGQFMQGGTGIIGHLVHNQPVTAASTTQPA